MSGSPTVTIPRDMAERLYDILGSLSFGNDEYKALGFAIDEPVAEADPEQPHSGVETQPPLTMRLHICGKHDRDEDRYQMPSIGEVILGENSRAHYKVIEVRWQGPRVADVLTMPVPGWATPEKF